MPRLPVYLPGWESGWKPGSSGGDSGGWSYSWKHCMLRGSRAFLPRESVLYIMYFFTFGGFFLYNFNKDCKQRLRLWFFFNFILFYFFLPLKYWLNLCLAALVFYIVAKGTPHSVLSLESYNNTNSCLFNVEVIKLWLPALRLSMVLFLF